MPKCPDCGEFIISKGICIECTDKRIERYPLLRERVRELEHELRVKETQINDMKQKLSQWESK